MKQGLPDFAYQARATLIDALKRRGPLSAVDAVRLILSADNVPEALAPSLLETIVGDDRRIRRSDSGLWEYIEPESANGLRTVDFVVVDVETTGGKPPADRITELGAARVQGGEIVDEFVSLVDPEREIPLNVQRVTGITDTMVRGKPTAAEILPAFREWIGGAVMVAHNAQFDRFFIDTHFTEVFGHPTENTWLCSVRLARKLYPDLKSKSLGPLCVSLGIPMGTLHRAGDDARATAHVLIRALDDLGGHGIADLDGLFGFVSPTVLSEKRRKQYRGADEFDDVV